MTSFFIEIILGAVLLYAGVFSFLLGFSAVHVIRKYSEDFKDKMAWMYIASASLFISGVITGVFGWFVGMGGFTTTP